MATVWGKVESNCKLSGMVPQVLYLRTSFTRIYRNTGSALIIRKSTISHGLFFPSLCQVVIRRCLLPVARWLTGANLQIASVDP